MKKRISLLTVIILLVCAFSSCNEIEIVELNERLIIEAIGIDTENGRYKITVEGLDSLTAGSDSNSISAEKLTKCYLFEGETVGMAMNSISEITGQKPLFSQARILVLGKSTAEEKLSEALDFFRREYTTRTDIPIAVAENTAEEIISANYGKNVSAGNILSSALSSYKYTGKLAYTPLYKFVNSVMNDTDCAMCPLIGIKDNAFSDTKEISLLGTAVFSKKGKIHTMSADMTQAMLIINDSVENGDMTVKIPKGICTLEIIDCDTKTELTFHDGKVHFSIKTVMRCDIPEFQASSFRGLSKDDTETVAALTSKQVSDTMSAVIDKFLYSKNLDIFDLGRRINLSNNDYYSRYIKNCDSYGNLISFDTSVTVSIRRIGKIVLDRK